MSRVINQYSDDKFCDETIYGECSFCGAEVRRNRCGCDEYCPECGSELDWSGVRNETDI